MGVTNPSRVKSITKVPDLGCIELGSSRKLLYRYPVNGKEKSCMKNVLRVFLVLVLVTGFTGCSNDSDQVLLERIEELEQAAGESEEKQDLLDRIEELEQAADQATTTTIAPTTTTIAPTTTLPAEDSLEFTPVEIGEQFGDAVWRIEIAECGLVGGGSSFAIGPNLFITNQHVLQADVYPTLISRDGQTRYGTVIGRDFFFDVAVIQVSNPVDQWLEWADPSDLQIGEDVVSLGYPAPYSLFTVSPGTLLSFVTERDDRIKAISDESSDYGSSGGPLLSTTGKVIGIVTNFVDPSLAGQPNGESLTYDMIGDLIEDIIQHDTPLAPSCNGYQYGTYESADFLWDRCNDENFWACDRLYEMTQYGTVPVGGEYEDFGATCGNRIYIVEECVEEFNTFNPTKIGQDPYLDELVVACENGDGDACDTLYWAATGTIDDDEYFNLAATCAYTVEFDTEWCGESIVISNFEYVWLNTWFE